MDEEEEIALLQRFETCIRRDSHDVFAPQLMRILQSRRETTAEFSVVVDSKIILDEDVVLGHLILRNPNRLLELFSKALFLEQQRVVAQSPSLPLVAKPRTHARINWLPSSHRKTNISSIRSHDVGSFLQFSGTVIRNGPLKVIEAHRVFFCGNPKCNIPIPIDFKLNLEASANLNQPSVPCPHCRKSSTFSENTDLKVCHDYQEIRVQEHVQKLGMGSMPRAITVLLMYDLVDVCKAGDEVICTGVLLNRWGLTRKDERCILETVVQANTVFVGNQATNRQREEVDFTEMWRTETPLQQRDAILAAVCPQLYGLYLVKLAVLLTLIGSPATIDPQTRTRVRGDPHLLLVGDPGTGKSQFLRFAGKVSNRAVLTTGVGTTQAGLTCSAVREGGEFVLEAGALVLADNGVCCIDEFSSIREHDRACIHEALEQQSLSVAKAGLVTQLNTRTTVIAATNPKGNYDVDATISANTNIAPPLLSRFDLIIVLLDCPDVAWDRVVSETLLQAHMRKGSNTAASGGESNKRIRNASPAGAMTLDQLRDYISRIKRIDPELSESAGRVLSTYYSFHRRSEENESGRTTLRYLESLIRLSKAHARLMFRDRALVGDALVAISLMELSILSCGMDGVGTLHIDFPVDPQVAFDRMAEDILGKIGLLEEFQSALTRKELFQQF